MNLSDFDPITFPPRLAPSESGADGLTRRGFLRLGALFGGGLALALYLRPVEALAAAESGAALTAAEGDFSPNLFIRITSTGEITLLATNPEGGQGVKTALPMIIAEELDAPWQKLRVVQAGLDARLGRQLAAGSRATPTHYEPFRRLGATARHVLLLAAAARWSVPVGELSTPGDARVVHAASGRSATYGELAGEAARLPLPDDKTVALKDPATFRLLGRRIGGVDNAAIVTGAPLFGLDVRRPGQKFAAFVKCPVFGGKVRSVELDAARA
nr:molybdopterin-dependent oxidoreductase [Opitutaceae bacterium]